MLRTVPGETNLFVSREPCEKCWKNKERTMLVLQRFVGEKLFIRNDKTEEIIEIVVIDIRRQSKQNGVSGVRLGIKAAEHFSIYRDDCKSLERKHSV